VGVVRNRTEQLKFALEKLAAALGEGDCDGGSEAGRRTGRKPAACLERDGRALIMIEYTDNREWVTKKVQPEIARRWPEAELILQPMSLTSGAHMGPGTWAVAFLSVNAGKSG
jgi:hypothetical protein